MLYDVEVTAEQLRAAADWAEEGQAPVRLLADDRMLLAGQGDERAAWDTGGEEGSEEYLSAAPLDPSPRARARDLAGQISVLAGGAREYGSEHQAAQSQLASLAAELARVILEGETNGASPTSSELAGPVGRELASQLIERVSDTIAGLPASSGEQRSAIATLTAGGLAAYAVQERGDG